MTDPTVKKTPPPIEQFEEWLREQEPTKRLTLHQRTIAHFVFSMPLQSGKSWLIENLYKFDNRYKKQQIVFRP